MSRARNQKDLFDEKPRMAELRPEVHNTVAILLQVLLTEAAAGEQRQTESTDRRGRGTDDGQHYT
ncbi:MAG: hypothetical protein JOZ74_02005 [Bradyrhizobium sp.]|nr:hypothetical protein [Bradyrhizobium sp.]